ncbi:endonuclease/exonuclease/phosphatase family protein [Vibrio pectenicida]|uniref:Endonuclease/exonuclease/phosphatase family protein n=1 Tax=Vibrio pectenicida TaxID=62763 RepID=A0A7Y4EET0_9VIBR|nr:endonuclease/exonuclease/phosphatase family protein [Vibrio pectenicida]NOH71688.1 endonuclease/exonuclease/phosphatase family protein [Vibrio pectenicida]
MLTDRKLIFATANLFNFIEPPCAFYDFENIYSREKWEKKYRWTRKTIASLDADILAIQEIFSVDCVQRMLQQLGYLYFVSVDQAHVESDYIYSHPIVALASKYPILQAHPVMVPSGLLEGYGIQQLNFSRKPIYAVVDVPDIGQLAVYVCHLKSQRETQSHQTDKRHSLVGQWLSSQQRGWEALMIRIAMEETYSKNPMPTVLMGDLNQPITSDVVGLLTKPIDIGSNKLVLQDSWDIVNRGWLDIQRPATHYHLSTGKVLDYILLSQEFQPESSFSMADIIQYQTIDSHLINPSFEHDGQASDHAFVSVTVQFVL